MPCGAARRAGERRCLPNTCKSCESNISGPGGWAAWQSASRRYDAVQVCARTRLLIYIMRRGAAALLPHTSSEPRPAFRRPHGPSSPPTPAIRIVLAGTAGCWLRRRPPPFFSSALVASLKSCHTNMEKASRLKRYFSSRHLVPRTSNTPPPARHSPTIPAARLRRSRLLRRFFFLFKIAAYIGEDDVEENRVRGEGGGEE